MIFFYGPMFCIYILSFQGPLGGLSFPIRGFSLHWFRQLIDQSDTGDLVGAIFRSLPLAVLVMVLTVAISFAAGMAFRTRFWGAGPLFYLVIAALVAPGYVLGIGIGLMFQLLGWDTDWSTSALGAPLLDAAVRPAHHVRGGSAGSARPMRKPPSISAPVPCKPCAWSSSRSCCQASSPWRCSASPCPTTNSPARCRPSAPTTPSRSRSGA